MPIRRGAMNGQILRIAARNLLRNKRRTAVTFSGLVLGIAAALVLQGFVGGLLAMMGALAAEGRLGAIQVHKAGHLQADAKALDFALSQDPNLIRTLLSVPGVTAVAPRLSFEATIGNGTQSTLALVTAVEPRSEAKVCPKRYNNIQGRAIADGDPNAAVLGLKLAVGMRAEPGSELQLLATARNGQPNLLDVKMSGLLPSATEIDARRLVIVPLAFAQQLLGTPGQVTEFALAVEHLDRADSVAALLRQRLGPGYEVVTWLDLMPQLRSLLAMLTGVMRGVVAVLILLLVTAVANTMWMSVLERVREIGTMMALGSRRGWIVRLLLSEAGVISAVGAMGGGAVGSGLMALLHSRGLPFSAPGSDVPTVMYPYVSPFAIAATLAIVAVATLLAAAGPAWRASKMTPVECLRAN
jgi:putative ABC transport system permease protein